MKYRIRCAELPLTVYREVAAHLHQVEGVETNLIPQRSPQFDYAQSQIGSLCIHYPDNSPSTVGERVKQILAYYGDRYGKWETIESFE